MKLKTFNYLILILMLLSFISCDSDPTSPNLSIEDKINAQKPITSIFIGKYGSTGYYFSSATRGFDDAYAEDGFFVIKSGKEYLYYILATANEIKITEHHISIYY